MRLERFSRTHASLVLVGLAAAIAAERPWVVALVGVTSLAFLWVRGNGPEPSVRYGAANSVTALRALFVVIVAVGWELERTMLGAVVVVVLALDGVDGWLARRSGTAGELGALFDLETDALFVLVVELVLHARDELGAWILTTGVLRYAYVLCRAHFPARREDVPRTRFGRFAFLSLALGLIAALLLPGAIGAGLAAAGTLLVCASFARSLYDSYARH